VGLDGPGSGDVHAPAFLESSLRQVLEDKIGLGHFAGAVFAGQANGLEVSVAAGHFDLAGGVPMPGNALFRLSSVSKAFISVLAARMIESGEISLDDPVTKFLPGFTPAAPGGSAPQITFGQLLTHTSGLSYAFSETSGGPLHRAGVSVGCESSPGLTLEENMRRLAGAPLLSRPGRRHAYSHSADVAGAAMAAAAGKSLPDLMRERVLDPLGLRDTGFHAVDPSRLGTAYVFSNKGPRPRLMSDPESYPLGRGRAFEFSPSRALDRDAWPSGGCGMVSSARDVMKLTEVINGLASGSPSDRWFMEDHIAPQVSSPGEGFAGGWAILKSPVPYGPYSPGTVTWGGVYGHRWFADPTAGISGVVLTNTAMKAMLGDTLELLARNLYELPR
jgi:CubicO group peptidase (beta-lactamase class C family)